MDFRYAFVTHWFLPAPVDRVWDLLTAPENWPQWWRAVERVEMVRRGGSDGVGAVRRYTWRSRLPYRLVFEMETVLIEPKAIIEGRATGELEGKGRWQLSADGDATRVRYDWQVSVAKPWMRWLSPVARPLFAWNHDVAMRWGREGLLRRLRE